MGIWGRAEWVGGSSAALGLSEEMGAGGSQSRAWRERVTRLTVALPQLHL